MAKQVCLISMRAALALGFLFLEVSEAQAIPVFAHRYGLSCQVCHTTVPHLTTFGEEFGRAGFRLPPSFPVHGAFPISVKVNIQYASVPEPTHLPKVILDELEFLSFASVTKHLSYRIEQYAVDGGLVGLTRDAWLSYTSRPEFGSIAPALRATAGQFTLPLPVDPETQRRTINHYAVFDQTVGSNPFNLFDDRIGLDAAYGRQIGGIDFNALALKGHDPQSGLPTSGLDSMFVIQSANPGALFSAYRYDGHRPLGPVSDRFWRQAIAANAYLGKAEIDALAQTGRDTSADGMGLLVNSHGEFAQLVWAFSPGLSGITRYDSTGDALMGRFDSLTTAMIFRVRPNMRFTIEGVSGPRRGAISAAWLFAY
jgi:hypothetical protein